MRAAGFFTSMSSRCRLSAASARSLCPGLSIPAQRSAPVWTGFGSGGHSASERLHARLAGCRADCGPPQPRARTRKEEEEEEGGGGRERRRGGWGAGEGGRRSGFKFRHKSKQILSPPGAGLKRGSHDSINLPKHGDGTVVWPLFLVKFLQDPGLCSVSVLNLSLL